jgi:DNA-binding NtrC family response regulator
MTEGTTAVADSPGILVVDDDALLLPLLETVFRRQGFTVWTAGTGAAALETYRQHGERIAIVLLDVCMPGMDGPQTLAELRRLSPGLRACFMSGFSGKYAIDELLGLGALCFFDKPFQVHDLAEQMWTLARSDQRRSA